MSGNANFEPANEADKPVRHKGRPDGAAGDGNQTGAGQEVPVQHSSRQGTVVIRATVEHIGLAGDTEMTVTVKWPASTFCVQPCAQPPLPGATTVTLPNVPPTGPAAPRFEPGPLSGSKTDLAAEPPEDGSDSQGGTHSGGVAS